MDIKDYIKFDIELITPQVAIKYLNSNISNRKIKTCTVSSYANDMISGNWKLTHQGIAFSKDGILKDGQHRLNAVVQSGIPVWMVVARYETDEDTVMAMDTGVSRTHADLLSISGYVDGEYAKARVIGFVNTFLRTVMHENHVKKTSYEVGDWINRYTPFIAIAKSYAGWGQMSSCLRSAMIAAQINGVDHRALMQFVSNLSTGNVSVNGAHYNYKAVRDFNDAVNKKSVNLRDHKAYNNVEQYAERCIYMFVNNIKYTKKEGHIYPVTYDDLDKYKTNGVKNDDT